MLYEDDPGGSMAYFIDNEGKKIRIYSEFADNLIENGRAVKINEYMEDWLPKDYRNAP